MHDDHEHPLGKPLTTMRTATGISTTTMRTAPARSTSSRRSWRRTTGFAERNRGWCAGRRHPRAEPRQLARLGQDDAAGAHDPRPRRPSCRFASSRATRRRPTTRSASAPTGCKVVQINTGAGCHLDAAMVAAGCSNSTRRRLGVMIENVGNLVCPALFDLGERAKVVVVSVTEGDDKPLKYPHMFRAGELMLLNKIDSCRTCRSTSSGASRTPGRSTRGSASCRSPRPRGDGLSEWYDWLTARVGAPAG